MRKIKKISAYLLFVFNALLIGIPSLIVIGWVFMKSQITSGITNSYFFGLVPFVGRVKTAKGYVNLSSINWTAFTKILGCSSFLLGSLTFLLSLFVLKSIFKNYQKGEIFSAANAISYKKLGWLFLADAFIVKPLSGALMVLAATLNNPPGQRLLRISFGTLNLSALFFGVLVIVVSWVMLEASKIHDEQKFTV